MAEPLVSDTPAVEAPRGSRKSAVSQGRKSLAALVDAAHGQTEGHHQEDGSDLGLLGGEPQTGEPIDYGKRLSEHADKVRKKTLLEEEALKDIDAAQPEVGGFLRTTGGLIFQVILFLFFVTLDVTKSLTVSKAIKGKKAGPNGEDMPAISQSLMITGSFLQVTIGLAVAYSNGGMDAVKMCARLDQMKRFAIVSLCFALGQAFSTLAYKFLEASTIKILGQTRLLQTALLTTFVMKKGYNQTQWLLITIIVFSALLFSMNKGAAEDLFVMTKSEHQCQADRVLCYEELNGIDISAPESESPPPAVPFNATLHKHCHIENYDKGDADVGDADQGQMIGFICVFAYLFCSDLGSVISERFLKSGATTPFYVQKATIEIVQLPISFVLSFVMPMFQLMLANGDSRMIKRAEKDMWWKDGQNLFQNWRLAVVLALSVTTTHSFMSGLLVKRMSAFMKLIGKVLSLGCVYLVGDVLQVACDPKEKDCSPLPCTMCAVLVMVSTYTYCGIENTPAPKPSAEESSAREVSVPAQSSGAGAAASQTSSDVELAQKSKT